MVVGAANLANSHVPQRRVLVVVAIVVAVAMVVVVRCGRSGRCGVVAVEVAVVAQEQPLGACPARVHGQKRPSYCRNHTPTIPTLHHLPRPPLRPIRIPQSDLQL